MQWHEFRQGNHPAIPEDALVHTRVLKVGEEVRGVSHGIYCAAIVEEDGVEVQAFNVGKNSVEKRRVRRGWIKIEGEDSTRYVAGIPERLTVQETGVVDFPNIGARRLH